MYSKELEELIEAILADGIITEKERAVLHRKAELEGVDIDEIDIMIDGRLAIKKNEASTRTAPIGTIPPPIPETRNNVSHKFGEVMKCPNCNAVVPPGTAKCEECGVVFRNIGAINSVQKFSDTINAIEARFQNYTDDGINSQRGNAIVSAIASFPVPNTKEDLLEFIIFTESKFNHLPTDTEVNHAIRNAYKSKYFECVDKARIYFNNDPQFQPIFIKYETNKKKRWKDISPTNRSYITALSILAVLFILALLSCLILMSL